MTRQIKLGMFLRPAGHHVAGWRHPGSQADGGVNFQAFVRQAQTAERGLFDLLFLADAAAVPAGDPESLSRMSYVAWIEPFSMMTALATVTQKIGLVCTASTTYEQPYHVARRFASLDLISGGRAGWNLVTSANANEAVNFGLDSHIPKDERYERAHEFSEVVRGLWDSWDDDAFIRDRESGRFFDPEKLHILDHKGKYFRVRGPLNVARSPQGQPVMVQAGASDDGRSLASEIADLIFAAHTSVDDARAYYADIKARAVALGRNPDHVIIMPGLSVTVGDTMDEAREKVEALQDLIHPQVGLKQLSHYIGFDLTGYPLDGPLPDIPRTKIQASRTDLLVNLARRDNLTIRQLYKRMAGARGHTDIYGTPQSIVDFMEEWFTTGAADGFNILLPVLPEGLDDFVTKVIPELQRRGLYRTAYTGATLRENLGVPFRSSRYADDSKGGGAAGTVRQAS